MITLEKLTIYRKYRGDIDRYTRENLDQHGLIVENKDFYTIDCILQDIEIIKKGLSTEAYLKIVNEKLIAICDSTETISEFKHMAGFLETNGKPGS